MNEIHNKKTKASTVKKSKKKNILIAIELMLIAIIIFSMYAYSRYSSKVNGTGTATIAKWSFKVNGQTETLATINLADTMKTNNTVKQGTVAPGTEGSFNLEIDGSGSEVAIEYTINLKVTDKPQNLNFYADSGYSQKIEASEGAMTITGGIPLAEVETPVTKTIYWKWPYRTGETDEEKQNNDKQDTTDSEKTVTMDITIVGIQKNPEEKVLEQGAIEILNAKEGTYTKGETIEIQAKYSEPVYAGTAKEEITAENAPVMKIKIGNGAEKTLTFAGVTNNENAESSIKYTYTVAQEDEGTMQIASYTGTVYSAKGTALQVAKKDLAKEIQMHTELQVGDIINYNPSGTYKWQQVYATSDKTESDDVTLSSESGGDFNVSQWRVLSIDKATGTVEMVPATIASGKVELGGAQGYNNAVYLLNEACSKLYGNEEKGIKARSIKEEDFVKAGGTKWTEARAACSDYGIQYESAYTGNKKYPTMYKKENNSVIDGSKKTDGYSQSEQNALIGRTDESATSGYLTAGTSIQPYQTYYSTSNYTKTAELLGEYAEILLPNKNSTQYWVASRCVNLNWYICFFYVRNVNSGFLFGSNVFSSGGGASDCSRAVCPVVSLSSQLLEKAENGTYNVK